MAWSIVDFEIPDLSCEDVPVALEWRQKFHGVKFESTAVRAAIGPSPGDKPMHVRKFGEAFFRPIMRHRTNNAVEASFYGQDADFLTGQSVAQMLSNFEDGGVFATSMPGHTHQRRLRKNEGDGLSDFESVEHHSRDRAVNRIKDCLSGLLLVDGTFYERCLEPTIIVFTADLELAGESEVGTFALVTTEPHLLTTACKRAIQYQVEDYQDAFKTAKMSNSSRGFHRHTSTGRRDALKVLLARINEGLIPIVDPDHSLYATDVAWMRRLNRIAVDVTAALGTSQVAGISEDMFSGYSKLYKALHTADDEERFDLMSDAMTQIMCAANGPDTHNVAAAARTALRILDDRPVSLTVPVAPAFR
jgi:hypothetical protein